MTNQKLENFPNSCDECKNVGNAFFCEINKDGLKDLSTNKTFQHYKKGQVVFHEGNHPFGLFCVAKGKIKVHKLGESGKDQIVRFAKKGDILGYRALLGDEAYSASATTMEPAVICHLRKNAFTRVLSQSNILMLKTITHLTQDLRSSEEKVMNMAQKPVRERIAESLIMLKGSFGFIANTTTIDIKLTRKEISDIAGATTETTIRTLSEFKKDGVIGFEGKKVSLLNVPELLHIAKIFD